MSRKAWVEFVRADKNPAPAGSPVSPLDPENGSHSTPDGAKAPASEEAALASETVVAGPSSLIAAAERHASFYNDDGRPNIVTDVLNAFYAGADWRAKQMGPK